MWGFMQELHGGQGGAEGSSGSESEGFTPAAAPVAHASRRALCSDDEESPEKPVAKRAGTPPAATAGGAGPRGAAAGRSLLDSDSDSDKEPTAAPPGMFYVTTSAAE